MRKNKSLNPRQKTTIAQREGASPTDFEQVLGLIETARHQAFKAVNSQLIELYWRVGGISLGKGRFRWLGQGDGSETRAIYRGELASGERVFRSKFVADASVFRYL